MGRYSINHMGPTTRRYSRHAPEPVGYARSRKAAITTGTGIVNLVHAAGPMLVLADPEGRVFAVPRDSERARIFAEQQPTWIVGVFNRKAAASDIAEAILATHNANAEEDDV